MDVFPKAPRLQQPEIILRDKILHQGIIYFAWRWDFTNAYSLRRGRKIRRLNSIPKNKDQQCPRNPDSYPCSFLFLTLFLKLFNKNFKSYTDNTTLEHPQRFISHHTETERENTQSCLCACSSAAE